ncbi:phospholipase D family protein [Sinorhizobium medicae]|nr:phospholipase D family protein [Sinorhizobium medicae]MBO1939777.1 phospholipase D family protein [Sinorhizobium medicae]MBO1962916.1 phospholipase D family protein [Sinorhizobium medicae]MDX0958923.1 phospholipase D family protein [Sinorhizobium medicae]UWU09893.1 phospholipase D family protein [Sinorhizobium medicae]WQO53921.1 phospholipase D family protein [Sinorhizobium medicae]
MMSWIALSLAALFGLLLAGVLYVYGWFGRRPSIDPTFALPVEGDETGIDKQLAPLLEAARSGENAVALISDNIEAFVARALSARRAGRSLDLQYYYWKDDLTGFLLTREVIRAADRGVRVRLLLDDVNAGIHDRLCISLDAHPNVDVRLFNPSRARTDRFRRGFELAIRAFSATRRMHNKLWIADGRLAISGGRNIGDAYFDAAELANFRDLDVWMAGPVVDQATAMFDLYWNSPSVLPIAALRTPRKHFLPALREALDQLARTAAGRFYLEKVQDAAAAGPGAYWGSRTLYRSANLRLAFDPPEKALMQKRQNWLLRELFPLIKGAKRDLRIISPYFIPGVAGTRVLALLAGKGAKVAVLTNSLAATDVAAVHGGYVKYRKWLLEGKVELYELKERGDFFDRHRMSLFGARNASLHTKAFVVDGVCGYVGSMNFDPRSASLNTEMGIVFSDEALASEIQSIFEEETAPERSYRLMLKDGRLAWQDRTNGALRLLRREPDAGLFRRLIAGAIRFLPLESQL